jgi:hypothetical protein
LVGRFVARNHVKRSIKGVIRVLHIHGASPFTKKPPRRRPTKN